MKTNFRELRLKAGLLQREIAAEMLVTEKTVRNWETGKSVPSKSSRLMFIKICEGVLK